MLFANPRSQVFSRHGPNGVMFISDTTTEENISNESSNETLSVKESCGTENQTDDKSVPGDPGGETVEKATNNQGTLLNISNGRGMRFPTI